MIYIIINSYWDFFNRDIENSLKKISLSNNDRIKILKIKWKNKENLLGKIKRYICFKLKKIEWILDCSEIEKEIFSKDDYVIFFDVYEDYYLNLIRDKTRSSKEIFWLWNKIEHSYIYNLKKISNNVWTFDKKEAEETKINYSSQFYWRKKEELVKEKYDIYFIGQDKGREARVLELKKNLDVLKFKIKIILKKYTKEIFKYIFKTKEERNNYSLSNIDYEEVVEDIKKSRVILELTKKNQAGLTLRALEALFYEKKLITDNENIKEYNFYNPNNIFILKQNEKIDSKKKEELEKFLEKDLKKISEEIKKQYSIENWLETLIKYYV